MIDRVLELPLGAAVALLWLGVMVRANTTYWIGRGLAAGTVRTRWAGMLDSPMYATAQRMARRWGVLAVPLSFLTVGVQTFVQLSAGVARMPLRLYLPAVAAGCLMWAVAYATVGLAVVATWLEAGGGWALLAGAVALAVVVVARRRLAARVLGSPEPGKGVPGPGPCPAGEREAAAPSALEVGRTGR